MLVSTLKFNPDIIWHRTINSSGSWQLIKDIWIVEDIKI